jgi:4-diphosphocytidyl-2-C-methyl-D-erythritol kinase
MICFPNAKINLGLHVVSRRTDGYHNLETVFYPIGLKDGLEIVPTQASKQNYRFFQTGAPLEGNPESNLVVRARNLIAEEKALPEMDILLFKGIPSGAGMGGGSSDAAFMLDLLNRSFELGYSTEELMLRAGRLGADCPFFLLNKPAFASGTGDRLEPIDINLNDYTLLVVKPNATVSTKEAYAMIAPRTPATPLKEIVGNPPETWREALKNDFEPPVFKKFPEICRVKQQLYEMGAVYASMSGSGASVFGLFREKPDWQGAFDGRFVWCDRD